MKLLTLTAAFLFVGYFAQAQVLPSFQFGIKAGANLSRFDSDHTFSSDNRAGYYAGVWARLGAAGIFFQPELYISGKQADLVSDETGQVNKVRFTSLDVPLLVGTKFGAAGVGLRLNTGPMFSLILDEHQSFGEAAGNVFNADFKNQALSWQFGAGLDVNKLSFDARYVLGISKINNSGYPPTRLSLFTIGLGYRLF
ncbi:porin family protein [Pedobacter endophyticus]|uniref:PorT family protein n=1 Tax=Pedobacter endophyticus TaxID=2789740 RepID=A0A7S9Q0S0_9SPHI|nr:porin family protein [Pedobacter endophyticus]QPH41076.1 PorT family protein [Pedobacter endophyticus]